MELETQEQPADYITLPALKNTGTRFGNVPRRYEETRPVIIQGSAHRKIICVGQEINETLRRSQHLDRENALRSTAESVWAEAESIKHQELQKALKKSQNEHEKATKKMQKAHERALRETALRVEGEMQIVVLERVQQEREEGEQRQKEAIHQVELRCQQELVAAVQEARREERQDATNKAAVVAQQSRDRLEAALYEADMERKRCLQELRMEMLQKMDAAVAETRAEEQKVTEERLQRLTQLYEQQIDVIKTHILEHKKEISGLEKEITKITAQKSGVEKELLDTREEFQKFIGSVKPFNDGEVDFLIPPLQSFNAA